MFFSRVAPPRGPISFLQSVPTAPVFQGKSNGSIIDASFQKKKMSICFSFIKYIFSCLYNKIRITFHKRDSTADSNSFSDHEVDTGFEQLSTRAIRIRRPFQVTEYQASCTAHIKKLRTRAIVCTGVRMVAHPGNAAKLGVRMVDHPGNAATLGVRMVAHPGNARSGINFICPQRHPSTPLSWRPVTVGRVRKERLSSLPCR